MSSLPCFRPFSSLSSGERHEAILANERGHKNVSLSQ